MRIAVVGGLNMDIHLFDTVTGPGQAAHLAQGYLAEPGGKGANQARAAARLGADVLLVGRVGDDGFGAACVDAVAADEVDVRFVSREPAERTGFVVIELVAGQHRSLVFAPGANRLLTWDHVAPALAEGPVDAVVTQAEVPSGVLRGLVEWSVRHDVPLFLDPSPPGDVPRRALTVAEAVTPDEEEVAVLSGRAVHGHAAPMLAARDLVHVGARRVLVKLDARGTVLAEPGRLAVVPTVAVDSVDETGAGDVFMAALVVSRGSGATWEEAVRFANAAASLSVSRPGLALPEPGEVAEMRRRIPDVVEELGSTP